MKDYWNVDGEREFVWRLDKLHKIHVVEREATWWIYIVQEWGDLRRNKTTSRPDHARQLRGIFLSEPEDEEFRHTMKNARRKLEVLMSAAKPCKTQLNSRWDPAAVLGKTRPNMLVLSMPTQLWGYDRKELYTNITKITSLQRGWIHWINVFLCTNSFRCLKH